MEENKENVYEGNTPPQKPKREKGFWLKVVALCVCCAIIGGIIGGSFVMYSGKHNYFSVHFDDNGNGFRFGKNFGLRFGFPHFFSYGIDDFYEDNFSDRNYLGVAVKNSDEPEGVYVDSVKENSPAEKGGIESGDIITHINNLKLDDTDELSRIINDASDGEELTLTIYRQGKAVECKVIIGEQDAPNDNTQSI